MSKMCLYYRIGSSVHTSVSIEIPVTVGRYDGKVYLIQGGAVSDYQCHSGRSIRQV